MPRTETPAPVALPPPLASTSTAPAAIAARVAVQAPEIDAAAQKSVGRDPGAAQPASAPRTTPVGPGMLGTPAELFASALALLRRNDATLVAELAPMIAGLKAANALDRADEAGLTLAMRAAALGRAGAVDALAKAGADLEARNPRTGANLLHYAAMAPAGAGTAILDALPRDAVARLVNQRIGANQHTVAMEAVFQSNEAFVRRLVELRDAGVDVDLTSRQLMGWSPRTFAARDGLAWHALLPAPDERTARILDAAGTTQADLRTQLIAAQGEWVRDADAAWLAAFTAPAERARAEQGMALLAAAQSGDLAAIDRLVASGVSLTGTYGRAGATVLTNMFTGNIAPEVMAQRLDTLRALLARGADPNVAESGLMLVGSGFREAVFGRTEALAIMIDAVSGDPARLRTFLDAQGPLNGYTKLIDAALRGNADVIALLVRSGADTSLAGYNGMTALDALRVFNARQSDDARRIPEAVLTRAG